MSNVSVNFDKAHLDSEFIKFADECLRDSGSTFIKQFSHYAKQSILCPESACNNYGDFESKLYYEINMVLGDYSIGRGVRGIALLGKTDFDKMSFIEGILKAYGLCRQNNSGKPGYVVIDCSLIKTQDDIHKLFLSIKGGSVIIFNNCEPLLGDDYTLIVAKRLFDEVSEFKIKPTAFIFLGKENTLKLAFENTGCCEEGVTAHLDIFLGCFCPTFDFDINKRLRVKDLQ